MATVSPHVTNGKQVRINEWGMILFCMCDECTRLSAIIIFRRMLRSVFAKVFIYLAFTFDTNKKLTTKRLFLYCVYLQNGAHTKYINFVFVRVFFFLWYPLTFAHSSNDIVNIW